MKNTPVKDYLWLNLRELPYFRGLLRAVEARYYRDFDLPRPILDVGCGDGQFATLAFDEQLDVGIDPWSDPLPEAARHNAYRRLIQSDGARMPFPDAYFGSAFSNSVLEHIPHIQAVLDETGRVLKTGAPFLFCVPNPQLSDSQSIGRRVDGLGLRSLGDSYRAFFNRIARHQHLDSPETWQKRLEAAGFEVERWWHYYAPAAMHVTEWGHYFGLPSWVAHKLTGRWIIVPQRWNLAITYHLVKKHYQADPECADGVCTFFIARRRMEVPLSDPSADRAPIGHPN